MERLHQIRAELIRPGARFEIEERSIRGIPTRTWKQAPSTLRTVFEHTRQFADREYLVFEGERLSYQQHYDQVAALAAELTSRFGVRKGERVAIAMRNYPEYVTVFWASLCIGAVVVPLNSWGTGTELDFALRDCAASVLFADGERIDSLEPFLADLQLRGVVSVRAERHGTIAYPQLFSEFDGTRSLPAVDIAPDDDATILYTSGTTGKPKGAVGTHRNACSTIWTTLFCLSVNREVDGEALPDPDLQKTALITTPLFHVIACLSGLMVQSFVGAKIVLMYKWSAPKALGLIQDEQVSSAVMVPAMWWQLIESQATKRLNVNSLERLSFGGAPSPTELSRRLAETFPNASLMTGFGMTETSSPSTHNFGEYLKRLPTSAGIPPPVCEMKAVDEQGATLAPRCSGELWIRGPNVVAGYWGRPQATAQAFEQGWVKSGDIGYIDEHGFVHIVDRLKDMVIRGGENVYCVEVEDAIVSYGGILEAAVVGIAHAVLGEEVAAVVLLEQGASVTEQALRDHLAESLAAFKIPSVFEFRTSDLPRNATGKVLKGVLRDELNDNTRSSPWA